MSTSQPPSPRSSSPPYGEARDPVVAIIENAGHEADPRVVEVARLAAAAHAQRLVDRRADGPAVNRSTFLWALGRVDDVVRMALEQNKVPLEAWEKEIGIRPEQGPLTGPYELAVDLERALRTFATTPRKMRLTIGPQSLATAVLEDVVANGGLVGERLRNLGTTPDAVLSTLHALQTEESDPQSAPEIEVDDALLPPMRDITPLRFGVQLPSGTEDPGPYVPRDVDGELGRQLRERLHLVAVQAPAASGAIRTVYEALRRERPDDRVLILHEWLASRPDANTVDDLDLYGLLPVAAQVVWVRNLGELVERYPVVRDWLPERGVLVAATLVLIARPEDEQLAGDLGLAPDTWLELTAELSADERSRAQALYDGEPTVVAALAGATVRRSGVRRANYAADSTAAGLLDQNTDDLGVRADVDMLAKLIASRDVHPPLSIGLFGPWGSGKTFLMNQVQLRIEDLGVRSKAIPASAAPPTSVNANADTTAKASTKTTGYLTEIIPVEFNAWQYAHGTALWAALINKVFAQVRVELTKKNQYEAAMKKIADKDVAVVKARVRLDAAQKKVTKALPAAEDRKIKNVVEKHGDISVTEAEQVERGMQVKVATSQMSELKDEYDRLRPLTAQVARAWSTASWGRRLLLVGGLAAIGALAVFYIVEPDWMAALLGAVIGALGAVLPLVGPLRKGLEQARKILRADARDKEELRRAEVDLARATEDVQAAKMAGFAGLYGFVNDRSKAAEYLQPLGMAPMIRDDLERLAELARGDDGIPGIDRIVIYIDDLDRCPASQVVQVLEAVNLLFGFELFVVVVAVDSRWLLRSLDTEFSAAFDKEDSSAPTAQNYLEKIIQIPFWVRPMRPAGFGRLITSLAGEVDERRGRADREPALGELPVAGEGPNSTGDTRRSRESIDIDDFGGHGPPEQPGPIDTPPPRSEPDVAPQGADESRPEEDLNPEALRITSDERDCMKQFLSLVGTPRAAKRFLNTYQLLRVSVDDVDGFLERREYEPLLLLLALVTGTAHVTDEMIAELAMTQSNFGAFLEGVVQRDAAKKPPEHEWQTISDACAGLSTGKLTPALIRTWLPKVARYSFHHVEW